MSSRKLTRCAIIAALYTALTCLLPIPQYGPIQLRLAEAMTLLPLLVPEAALGLTVGCFLSNVLGSPYVLDWLVGPLATFLAAVLTGKCRKVYLAAVPPVALNAVFVGAEVAFLTVGAGEAFWPVFGLNVLTIGAGEAVVCGLFGVPLVKWMGRNVAIRELLR